MKKVIVEIDGERHILKKDRGFELECSGCSLQSDRWDVRSVRRCKWVSLCKG